MKSIIKKTILWILFAGIGQWGWAQSDANITGHVIDKASGEHIPYVTVQIKGTTSGAMSDETGHYYLSNLRPGNVTLVYSIVGYDKVEKTIEVSAHKTIEVNVTMHTLSSILDAVVVSANKYETKQKEAASIVNVISPLIFDATNSVDMASVLDYQTGLRVEMSCQNCGMPQLSINGLSGQYTQILMDSRPMFSSLASVYGLEQVPAGMVDRVEVVRGGGSALFGANAIGGVVNIITKEASRNFVNIGNTTSLIGGQAADLNTTLNASVVSKDSKMGVFLFGVQRQRNAFDYDQDGYSEIPELNSTMVGFRSFFRTSMNSKLTLEYHHVNEFRRGGNLLDLPAHQADIAEQLDHAIDALSLKFNFFTPDNHHDLSIYASGQNIDRKSYYGTHQDPNAYGSSHDITAVTGMQYRFSYMQACKLKADFSAGLEYTFNELNDKILGYGRNLWQTTHLVGLYAQNEWHNETLSILAGARLEKHSFIDKPVAVPRASIRYTPFRNVIGRLTYSSGYRAPQAYDEDLHVGAVNGDVYLINLDPDLRPEYSNSLSLSTDLYKHWGNCETNLTIEGFYTRLNDVFVLTENGYDSDGNLLMMRTNSSGAYVTGINIEGRMGWRNIVSVQLGYTYQNSRYVDPFSWSSNPAIAPQKRMFRTPDNYGYAVVDIDVTSRFCIALSGKYSGSMLVQHFAGYVAEDEEVESDPFFDMGAKISYSIPIFEHYSVDVSCGVKNLFNSYQRDLDQGVERDSGYIYGPSLPRTYFLGASIKM